jgi:hypothetical protein
MFGTYTYTCAAGRQLTPFEQREADARMGRLFAALSGLLAGGQVFRRPGREFSQRGQQRLPGRGEPVVDSDRRAFVD